jgi:hypothetical protein
MRVIWLNGPPGSGKSCLQASLCSEGWGAAVSAERIGQDLQAILPVDDYQSLPAWPVHVTQEIQRYRSGAVIDMTCVNRRVRSAYRSIFATCGIEAVEIGLTAQPSILESRVISRGGEGVAWCLDNLRRLHGGWAELDRPTIDTSIMGEQEVLEKVLHGLRSRAWPVFG